MNINLIAVGLLFAVFASYLYTGWTNRDKPLPSILPWVPIDVSKSRSFVNQTKDAGMFTEFARRTAIISNPDPVFGNKSFSNGAVEWNFLTSVCVCPPRSKCPKPGLPVTWSAGDADDEICDIVDSGGAFGGYDAVDFGGAAGNVCQV